MSRKVNINDRVRVQLTAQGFKFYTTKFPSELEKLIKSAGVLDTQLWRLFQDFNTEMYMGNTKPPFENNVIEFIDDGETSD